MANSNKPMGLSPHSYLSGAKWTGQATMYVVLSGDSNAYAIGDPVVLGGTGDAAGVASVVLATAGTGNNITGAIVGLGATTYGGDVGSTNQFGAVLIPASATVNTYVLVADDPELLFEVQEGGAGTALATTDIGTNINLLSGSNNGYVSGWLLNNNSKATTNTFQMQLMRLVQRVDNTFGANAKWLARINTHSFKAGTTGV